MEKIITGIVLLLVVNHVEMHSYHLGACPNIEPQADFNMNRGNYSHMFEVLDQPNICNEVSPVFYGPWMQELKSLGVAISDLNSQGPVEMLLGTDVLGKIFTGKRHMLTCGLVAYESYVGWTFERSISTSKAHRMTVIMSMLNNPSITELWRLDILGIQEPAERKTKSEIAAEVKNLFDETVVIDKEGSYEVRLPWIEDHPLLPTNYDIAKKRLQNTLQKLKNDNLTSDYEGVFQEWECLKIIEKTNCDATQGYFLPHRPVVKEGTTTKMLGIWYVMQKTSTASSCIVYNITRTDEPGEYRVEEISQHFLLALTPLKHGYHYTGNLKVPDSAVPARMTVKFPLSVAGKSSFTVFMTDYETYAGIFTCQKLTFAHRQSATILSRTKTLDKMYIDKLRSRLASSQIDPFEMSLISQNDCPRNLTAGYNINIDDETISAKSAADVIRKAGEKIGDGVEYISGKTKEVYHKVADKSEDTSEKVRSQVNKAMDADAEWLP